MLIILFAVIAGVLVSFGVYMCQQILWLARSSSLWRSPSLGRKRSLNDLWIKY